MALRPLTPQEYQRAFVRPTKASDLKPYVDTVREMEGGVGYGIPLNGTKPRALKWRMNKAAKSLALELRWAPVPDDATELYVELSE
jgi:hypothetical protein